MVLKSEMLINAFRKLSESVTPVNKSGNHWLCRLQTAHMKNHVIKNNKLGKTKLKKYNGTTQYFMILQKHKTILLLLLYEKYHKFGQKKIRVTFSYSVRYTIFCPVLSCLWLNLLVCYKSCIFLFQAGVEYEYTIKRTSPLQA